MSYIFQQDLLLQFIVFKVMKFDVAVVVVVFCFVLLLLLFLTNNANFYTDCHGYTNSVYIRCYNYSYFAQEIIMLQ